jgi:hypothetical protein
MKITTLSILTTLALASTSLSALTLYQDPSTGQVFTKGGEGRLEMGDFVNAKTIYSENEAQDVKIEEAKATVPSKGNGITILDLNSPEFLLGKQTHINMKFVPQDAPDMWFKAGIRVQGTMESEQIDYKGNFLRPNTDTQDAYLRRVRLEVAAGFGHGISYVMYIRNDKSNYGIENKEGKFSVGDAYIKIKKPFDTSLVNFKLYRAKIDVSRTETVKSARVIAYDRPYVADIAAQYISFNRRGANVQMYGNWEKKIHYQVAFGSATSPDKIKDAIGGKQSQAGEVTDQSFFYGGKIVLSPFDGWEEKKRTETYFGVGKHFSIGMSYWDVPSMEGTLNNGTKYDLNHQLMNVEVSGHYKGLFLQAEYFKFKDTVENWAAPVLNTGDAEGWYVTGEYVMPELGYIAPFFRYEYNDRFENAADTDLKSTMLGINWYLKGNSIKAGLYVQRDQYDKGIANNKDQFGIRHEKDVDRIRLTSQFFF